MKQDGHRVPFGRITMVQLTETSAHFTVRVGDPSQPIYEVTLEVATEPAPELDDAFAVIVRKNKLPTGLRPALTKAFKKATEEERDEWSDGVGMLVWALNEVLLAEDLLDHQVVEGDGSY